MNNALYNLYSAQRAYSSINSTGKAFPWVFICSTSLALHAISKGFAFRRIQDIDIYIFKGGDHLTTLPYETKVISGRTLTPFCKKLSNGLIDIFSNGYVCDTIPPLPDDTTEVLIDKVVYPISSVEHTLMLKLFTTYRFREKELKDIKFMLRHFNINHEVCAKYFPLSKYSILKLNKSHISINSIDSLLEEYRYKILEQYISVNDIFPLVELPYEYLVTLLNFESIEIADKQIQYHNYIKSLLKFEKVPLADRFLYYLGTLYLTQKIRFSFPSELLEQHIATLFYSSREPSRNKESGFFFLTAARYLNKIINHSDFEEALNILIAADRFINCFFRISQRLPTS